MKQVTTPGEAISVLIQVAELAQAKGILTFEDAVITKSAIDLFNNMSKESNTSNQMQQEEILKTEKIKEYVPDAYQKNSSSRKSYTNKAN